MRSKFIDSKDAKNSFVTKLPAGRHGKLQFTLSGTTDTGQTLTLADLGTVTITQRGVELQRATAELYHELADNKGGFPATVTGNAATAERVVWYTPFSYTGYANTLQLFEGNEVEVRWEPNSNLSTRFGSNAVTLRIDTWEQKDVAQSYNFKLLGQNQQASAAGDITDNLSGPNIVALLLRDDSDVVTSVNTQIGGEVILDNTPFDIIQDETNILNRIESSGNGLAEVAVSETGIIESTFNQGGTIQTTFSGSGTMELYKVMFGWLPANIRARNENAVRAYLQSKG